MTRYAPRCIVGVNIVPPQVKAARQRVEARYLADRIRLHLASATDLPFEAGRFTAITALECGFHFATTWSPAPQKPDRAPDARGRQA